MVFTGKKETQLNGTNIEPRNKPALNGLVTPDKGGKKIQWAKNSLFNKQC